MEQETEIKTGKVLAIGYNTIYVKEDNGNLRNIYFDGLQKRLLRDVEEETLKRLKRVEFVGEEDWNVGIKFFVCCDLCDNALHPLFEEGRDIWDKNRCSDCWGWVCSDCFDFEREVCRKCLRRSVGLKLRT